MTHESPLRGLGYDDQIAQLKPSARAPSAAVQAQGGSPAGDVHQLAAHGVSGSGAALPHLETIQASFGKHDVGSVQAFSGGKALQASEAMGAEAYATGNKIAFGSTPDLHTAAHEAAHVVQQRAGVSLSGGVGQAGDRYEQHADAVADAVVQRKNAEPILDAMVGHDASSGDVQHNAVQRRDPPKGTTKDTTKDKVKADAGAMGTIRQAAETIKTQYASNFTAMKTAVQSFERFTKIDAMPAGAGEKMWEFAIDEFIKYAMGKAGGAGKVAEFALGAYKEAKKANAAQATWKAQLKLTQFVQGLDDYFEASRVSTETYWNGDGSVGVKGLVGRYEGHGTQEAAGRWLTDLVKDAERFNKADLSATVMEQALYEQWLFANTSFKTLNDRTAVLEVEYRLDKDDKSHKLEKAELKVTGSGGLVARMAQLHANAASVADFNCRKTVRFTEYDPGILGDRMTRRSMGIYHSDNRVLMNGMGGVPLHQGTIAKDYGLTSLNRLRLGWSDVTAK